MTQERDPRLTAIHEAGHAVAAWLLEIDIERVTIAEHEGASGHVEPTEQNWPDWLDHALEEADYDASWGGFVKNETRNWVERQMMFALAGGLALTQAMGVSAEQAGTGMGELDDAARDRLVEKWPELEGTTHLLLPGGDLTKVLRLAEKVSGSDEEASAYINWMEQRTLNLMHHPRFWPGVHAVADELLEHKTLSGQAVERVVQESWEAREGQGGIYGGKTEELAGQTGGIRQLRNICDRR